MPESVLAAIIAGTATLSASFLQLRTALIRDKSSGRGGTMARYKNRIQLIILLLIVAAAAFSGFLLSQWLTAGERLAQRALQRELQARIAEISRTTEQLEITRNTARAEIEHEVLRQIGLDGVTVLATVPACRPTHAFAGPGADALPSTEAGPPVPVGRGCSEAEASAVTLCATIPGNAKVGDVELYSRFADAEVPWNSSRFLPGQESAQARFLDKYSESAPEAGVRQVCQGFTQWSAEHARLVRMIVRYSL